MTEQITIKLNKELFRPLIDELRLFAGQGIADSDSDLVGKALFFCYFFVEKRQPHYDNKTVFDWLLEQKKREKAEAILNMLNEYYLFKKKGLVNYKKNNNNHKR